MPSSDEVDGRQLRPLAEPGSDALLLLGLLLFLAKHFRDHHNEEETP